MISELGRTVFAEEHEAFRRTVRGFLEHEVVPHYAGWEDQGFTPAEIWRRAGAVGLLGTSIAEEYGGAGVTSVSTRLCWKSLGASASRRLPGTCTPTSSHRF